MDEIYTVTIYWKNNHQHYSFCFVKADSPNTAIAKVREAKQLTSQQWTVKATVMKFNEKGISECEFGED
jgi:hypothetical protein